MSFFLSDVYFTTRYALRNLSLPTLPALKSCRWKRLLFNSNTRRGWSSTAGSQRDTQPECSQFNSGQANTSDDVHLLRVILPQFLHPNGFLQGRILAGRIVEIATIAAQRYCKQQQTVEPTSCSLDSINVLEFFKPLKVSEMVVFKPIISADAASQLLTVDVSVERSIAIKPDFLNISNHAQLSFKTFQNTNDQIDRPHSVVLSGHHATVSKKDRYSQNEPPKESKTSHFTMDPKKMAHPENSTVSFIHPVHMGLESECRPEHLFGLMEEHGMILTSRLLKHQVATVHVTNVRFLDKLKAGGAAVVSGKVVSVTGDAVTLFMTVDGFFQIAGKIQQCRTAEAFISYVAFNSRKEIVPITDEILSAHPHLFTVKDRTNVTINQDVIKDYTSAFKKRE